MDAAGDDEDKPQNDAVASEVTDFDIDTDVDSDSQEQACHYYDTEGIVRYGIPPSKSTAQQFSPAASRNGRASHRNVYG